MGNHPDVDSVVDRAIDSLGLRPPELFQLDPSAQGRVLDCAHERFVNGNPRAWWMSLRPPSTQVNLDLSDNFGYLRQFWPNGESTAYFIPENDSKSPRVFECTLNATTAVLSQAPWYEYYIVRKGIDWLVAESDEGWLYHVASDVKSLSS